MTTTRSVTTRIDAARCTGCTACVKACPADTLSMHDKKAVVTGERCLVCGHCAAICPVDAVTVSGLDPQATQFSVIPDASQLLKPGELPPELLLRLFRTRRSCRAFDRDKAVSRALLDDLVKVGTSAPSGTNSQLWTFTLLPNRAAVEKVGEKMGVFFAKINKIAANPAARAFGKVFLKDGLGIYHREYAPSVEEALKQWKAGTRDRLFHGAPALILIGAKPGASCGPEDALLAAGQILLAAETLGLGTCLIGFAVEAIKRDKSLKAMIGIPKDETIYAAVAVGYSKEHYRRPAGRLALSPRVFDPQS